MKYNRLREKQNYYRPKPISERNSMMYDAGMDRGVRERYLQEARIPKINGALAKLIIGLCGMLLSAVMLMLTVVFIFTTASGYGSKVRDISEVRPGYEGMDGVRLRSLRALRGFSWLPDERTVLPYDVPCVMENPYMNESEYTHFPENAGKELLYGVDVSSKQGGINWLSFRTGGMDFAMLRAGSRGYSEGQLYEDKAFDVNAKCAVDAGVRIGAYVYSQATNIEEVAEETDMLLRRVKNYKITMPLVYDFEFADVGDGVGGRLYEAKLTVEQATEMCLYFCRRVRDEGYTPMIYANSYMLNNCVDAARLAEEAQIWIAYPSTELKYEGVNSMWQYSWSGRVPGIIGEVDMDFGYGY